MSEKETPVFSLSEKQKAEVDRLSRQYTGREYIVVKVNKAGTVKLIFDRNSHLDPPGVFYITRFGKVKDYWQVK